MDSGGVGVGRRATADNERKFRDLLSRRHHAPVNHGGGVSKLKTKPTQVIVHRIEFQQKERELLEMVSAAYSVGAVVKPITTLFTDEGFLIFITLLLESMGVTDWMPDNLAATVGEWGKEGWAQFWDAAADNLSRPSDEQREQISQVQVEGARFWAVVTAMLSGIKARVS
jgi:hypothetical protein